MGLICWLFNQFICAPLKQITVCIQEACLRDFICITSTAICQPDIKGGGLAIKAILIIVHSMTYY